MIVSQFTISVINDGNDGRGIVSTSITYQASTNGVTTPTGEWLSTIPTVNSNQFLWTRTIITYTSGDPSTIYSVSKNGKGIVSTARQFRISTLNTELTETRADGSPASWVNTNPSASMATNEYLWTRYVYTYDDGSTSNGVAEYDSVIDGVSSMLDTANRTIKEAVWQNSYFTVLDPDTGQPVQMNIKNTIVESVTDITGIEQRVSTTETNLGDFTNSEYTLFKQSVNQFQTEVTNNLNNTTTIATQTAEDFSWMFSKGVYDAYLVDEDGNYVIDENGNFIKAEKESPDGSARIIFTREGIDVVNGIISIKAPNGETTIIEGGKINTNRIVSLDGTSWINLGLGTFNYGNKLTWNGATLTVDGEIYARTGNIASGVVIGDPNGYHAVMNPISFDVFDSTGSTKMATFGAVSIIGDIDTQGVKISSDGFLYRSNSNDAFTVGTYSRQTITEQTRNATTYSSTQVKENKTYYRIAQIASNETVLRAHTCYPVWNLTPDSMIIGSEGEDVNFFVENGYLWVDKNPTDDGTADWDGIYYLVSGVTATVSNPYYCFGYNEFYNTTGGYVPGKYSLSHGRNSNATGEYSITSGNTCLASDSYASAFGFGSLSEADFALSYGRLCKAHTKYSIAIGNSCWAYGDGAIAIGDNRRAIGRDSVAIGGRCYDYTDIYVTATANYDSSAQFPSWDFTIAGVDTFTSENIAAGYYLVDVARPTELMRIERVLSVTETSTGVFTIVVLTNIEDSSVYTNGATVQLLINPAGAYALGSVSFGNTLSASAFSTSLGFHTITNRFGGLTVGMYNDPSISGAFQIGNGTDDTYRHTSFWINANGDIHSDGYLYLGGSATASKFIGTQNVLWSGVLYMGDGQYADLSESISSQANGIVLVWSYYNPSTGTAGDWGYQYDFIPKQEIISGYSGFLFKLAISRYQYVGTKYIYASNTRLSGHADNTATGTLSGITFANNRFVLRRVIGV